MCGIVGIIAMEKTLSKESVDFFETLLYHDTVRGPHSTGVMGLLSDGKIHTTKEAYPGPEFLSGKKWASFRKKTEKAPPKMLFGHNRWATQGAVTHANAHPFYHEPIVLMHNGTLWNKGELNKMGETTEEVDSSALCSAIANKGWKSAIDEATGSWALVWYDFKEKSLSIMRNHERPLHWVKARVRGDSVLIFASEEKMLDWLITRHTGIWPAGKIEQLKANTRQICRPTETGWNITYDEYQKPYKAYNYGPYAGPQHYGWARDGAFDDNDWETWGGSRSVIVPRNITEGSKSSATQQQVIQATSRTTLVPHEASKIKSPGKGDFTVHGEQLFVVWQTWERYGKSEYGKLTGYPVSLQNKLFEMVPGKGTLLDWDIVFHGLKDDREKDFIDNKTIWRVSVLRGASLIRKELVVKMEAPLSFYVFDSDNDKVVNTLQAHRGGVVLTDDEKEIAGLPEKDKEWTEKDWAVLEESYGEEDIVRCDGCSCIITPEAIPDCIITNDQDIYCNKCELVSAQAGILIENLKQFKINAAKRLLK